MTEKKKKIRISAETKNSLSFDKLEPFQGQLKYLPKEAYESLRKTIIDEGFSFAVHVWEHKKHHYILDGHQRVFTVKQMVEVEGFESPDLPVVFVKAESFAEAKRKVLAGASQYGVVNKEGLWDFLQENKIDFGHVAASFKFPEIDFGDFAKEFLNIASTEAPEENEAEGGKMNSGSNGVRQIQLFFDAESYLEFVSKLEALAKLSKTDNVSDTALEVVRAYHKLKIKA